MSFFFHNTLIRAGLRMALLAFTLLLTNCSNECLDDATGGGSPNQTNIPGNPLQNKTGPFTKKDYWTDAGYTVAANIMYRLDVAGAVNLCGSSTANTDITMNVNYVANNNIDGTGSIDSGMSVNAGDVVTVQLVPKTINISDCNNPPAGVYVADINKCKYGYTDKDNNKVASYINRSIIVQVGVNDVPSSPSDNVLSDDTRPWVTGGRLFIVPESYDTSNGASAFPELSADEKDAIKGYSKSKNDNTETVGLRAYMCDKNGFDYNGKRYSLDKSKVTAMNINTYCGNIVALSDKTTCAQWEAGIRSFSVPDINKNSISILNDSCTNKLIIPADSPALPANSAAQEFAMPIIKNSIAYRLYGYVKNSSGSTAMVLPDTSASDFNLSHTKDMYGQTGISLGHAYLITKPGRLSFNILSTLNTSSQKTPLNKGGYRIRVTKECPAINNLYMYISSPDQNGNYSAPDLLPGEAGTIKIPLPANINTADSTIYINDNKLGAAKAGRVYFGIQSDINNYNNITGSYNTTAWIPTDQDNTPYSSIVLSLEDTFMDVLFGQKDDASGVRSGGAANLIYTRIINNTDFQTLLMTTAALAIAWMFITTLAGVSQLSMKDSVSLLIKLGIILQLLRPNSWEFFNTYLFNAFTVGMFEFIDIFTTPADATINSSARFVMFDNILTQFTTPKLWLKPLSWIVSGPLGPIYFLMFIWGSFHLLLAIFRATILLYVNLVMFGILMGIFPICLLMIAMPQTKSIMESWFKIMGASFFQVVLVFAAISQISVAMEMVLNTLLSFQACASCALSLDIGSTVVKFCLLSLPMADGINNDMPIESRLNVSASGAPNYFVGLSKHPALVLTYITLARICSKIVELGSMLANSLVGLWSFNTGEMVSGIVDDAKWLFGQDERSRQDRMYAQIKSMESQNTKGVKVKGDGKKSREKGIKEEYVKKEVDQDSGSSGGGGNNKKESATRALSFNDGKIGDDSSDILSSSGGPESSSKTSRSNQTDKLQGKTEKHDDDQPPHEFEPPAPQSDYKRGRSSGDGYTPRSGVEEELVRADEPSSVGRDAYSQQPISPSQVHDDVAPNGMTSEEDGHIQIKPSTDYDDPPATQSRNNIDPVRAVDSNPPKSDGGNDE